MLTIDRNAICTFFKNYTDAYNASDPKIKLKIDHTYRVADLAEQIAVSEQMPQGDIELCWLMGMLHDIGRFEQIKRYGTFVDAKSIDHATFGADLLFQEGLIREIFPEECIRQKNVRDTNQGKCQQSGTDLQCEELSLCETAIRNHSIYQLPSDLTDRERAFCNVLRDADKIDILRVNLDTPMEVIYNTSAEVLKKESITPEVLQAFSEHHAVLRSLKKTGIDNLVGHAAMIFELVYASSRRIVDEQGYLWKLLEYNSENPETRKKLLYMKEELENFIRCT